MTYFITNVVFNLFIMIAGMVFGAASVIAQAKEFGYMKKDPKDGKVKWRHQIRNTEWYDEWNKDKKEDKK